MHLRLAGFHGSSDPPEASLRAALAAGLPAVVRVPPGEARILGRTADQVDFRLPHPSVARRHVRVRRQDEALVVSDLKSPCGILVNGRNASGEVRLAAGDRLTIGDIEYVVVPEEPAPGAPDGGEAEDSPGAVNAVALTPGAMRHHRGVRRVRPALGPPYRRAALPPPRASRRRHRGGHRPRRPAGGVRRGRR